MDNNDLLLFKYLQEITSWNEFAQGARSKICLPATNKFLFDGPVDRAPSSRTFTEEQISETILLNLCKSFYSINKERRSQIPSAGNIQQVKIKILKLDNGELLIPTPKGQLKHQDFIAIPTIKKLIYDQINGNGLLFLIYASIAEYVNKYGIRSFRFLYLEAGHMCHEMILQCQKQKLSSCAIAGFNDEVFIQLIENIHEINIPLNILAAGKSK